MSVPIALKARAATVPVALVALLLCGCSTIHRWTHREPSEACRETPFNGSADTSAPLRVPDGLNAPDTTGAIKIPQLGDAEQQRPRTAPCLDMPPSYGSEPTGLPPPRRAPR